MEQKFRNQYFWILTALCLISLLLFLGQSYFHTRGEPREALVAFAMLEKGNWILPITNGVDMAYKPPLFHWAIACISSIVGEVTEYTSRMPSALSLIAMVLAGFLFYAKRRGHELAFLASIITLTNFEVHRAGMNCRVDMLLTALMVIALFQLYRWAEKKLQGIPWLAILCLSGAILTKGPVGLVLPCLVVAIFVWIRGMNFFRIFISFLGVALASCILPALWYIAAWKQGGEQFLALVLEENVLRFLGKMTYASHENPWHYNVLTLVSGFVPYTILLLISLFTLKYTSISGKPIQWWSRFKQYIKNMNDTRLFSLLSIIIMFTFYCIPKSKRSVYLLPIYPFIAYYIAEYIVYLVKNKPISIKIFNIILCSISILLGIVFVIVRSGLIPHSLFQGKHATENIAYLEALETMPLGLNIIIIILPLGIALYYLCQKRRDKKLLTYFGGILTMAIFFALDGVYQPAVLNTKSNKRIAEMIQTTAPDVPVYSYITRTAEGNRLHPFTLNYYLGNRIVPFIDFAPSNGILLLGEKEYDGFIKNYGDTYILQEWPGSRYKSCDNREMTHIYTFKKK